MAGTIKRLAGPTFLSNTYTTNIYNQSSALLYTVIRKMHIVNKTAGSQTFRLFIGATGANTAGTELYYDYAVAANSEFNVYGALRLDSTDFLVGGASAASSLVITIEGDLNAV